MNARDDGGQATVEFALLLPLVLLLLMAVVQAGLLVRDQVAVVHAAREAVRAAAVDPDPRRALFAGRRVIEGADVEVVERGPVGDPVEVKVTYRAPTDVPLVGALVPEPVLTASAVMRVER